MHHRSPNKGNRSGAVTMLHVTVSSASTKILAIAPAMVVLATRPFPH
jgi:hypothetical protein